MPYFETSDGTSLYYRDWGTGQPVVFVSSWALSGQMWEYQTVPLSRQELRCMTFDRRGHGRSDDPGRGYDFDTLADDLAALINHLNLRDVILVAHSMGCAEVARYLSRHGASRIAKVALISPIRLLRPLDGSEDIPQPVLDAIIAPMIADRARYFTDGSIKFFGLGSQWPTPPIMSREMVEWGIRLILESSPRAALDCWYALMQVDCRADMAAFTMPTLIIHGDNDQNAPLDICARRIAEAVPGSKLVIYEGAPHGLFLTDRERLTRDLLAFVQSEA
jgi:non-heme chloroperoxidase